MAIRFGLDSPTVRGEPASRLASMNGVWAHPVKNKKIKKSVRFIVNFNCCSKKKTDLSSLKMPQGSTRENIFFKKYKAGVDFQLFFRLF